jgi:outer membrane cobalamin receptor
MTFFTGLGAHTAPRQKKIFPPLLLAALLSLFSAPPARAAVNLPEEVVAGSVIYDEDEGKYLSPGMATVIRPDERTGEQRGLPALLDEVPGLRVIRVRGRNGYAVASVRGSTASQVAVYVDGILMNLQSEAAVDLSAIPADGVERIEVYRGYVPARFGAQAMGGVINIVTKSPETRKTNLSLGTGSFGRYKGSLSHSAPMGGGKFFGSLGYETYDGDFEFWNDNDTAHNKTDDYYAVRRNNGFENADILVKWNDDRWRARASWARRYRELPYQARGNDKPGVSQRPGALLDTDRWDASLGRSQESGGINWSWELAYTGQKKHYESRRGSSISAIGGLQVSESEYGTSRFGVSVNADKSLGERHFLELLAAYSSERLDVDGDTLFQYLGGKSDYRHEEWDLNLQDTIALDRAGTFLLTPSIRWHKLEDESHFTWQAALAKEFSPGWILKGAYGTYARAPNLYEKYGDGAYILPAENDMKWEKGTQLDIGLLWNGNVLNARSDISLSAFRRETKDLIEFIVANPRYGVYRNMDNSETDGVELEASFDWEKWNVALSATWMDAFSNVSGSRGARLPNRPEWSGFARMTRKFTRGSAFIEYQYTGENYADSSETVLFDERKVFNAGVKYDLSPTTQLIAGVNDIFDNAGDWRMRPNGLNGPTRILWFPDEGRSYYLTLNVEF